MNKYVHYSGNSANPVSELYYLAIVAKDTETTKFAYDFTSYFKDA